jgi:homoserine O-acetyltransferase
MHTERRATACNPGRMGHFARGGINPDDIKFIDDALKELLAE